MKVKDMPNGAILWNGYNILGIKGNTLEEKYGDKYYDYDCIQENGNLIDFSLCLENNELREITDRIQSEYNDLLKNNFKLKYELETKRKEYQETYKDVREELKELRKENEQLKKQVQRQINKWNKDIKSNYISKHEVKDKNMSEEEKEAIEYLKTRLYGNEGCKYIDVAQEDLRIFINLIDRLQNKKGELAYDKGRK